jgi:hypothetical protein
MDLQTRRRRRRRRSHVHFYVQKWKKDPIFHILKLETVCLLWI